jgi:putative ABC transport system substrate-binding protein
VSVAAPVEMGLVESLAHPGGNMTGITFEAATETYAKRLQILKEIAPNLSRVAVLGRAGDPNMGFAISSIQKAAPLLDLTLLPLPIKSADDLATTFEVMQSNRADGLLSVAGNLTSVLSRRIAELALTHQLPSCHPFRETVIAGGLIGLGPDRVWMAKQAATTSTKSLTALRQRTFQSSSLIAMKCGLTSRPQRCFTSACRPHCSPAPTR